MAGRIIRSSDRGPCKVCHGIARNRPGGEGSGGEFCHGCGYDCFGAHADDAEIDDMNHNMRLQEAAERRMARSAKPSGGRPGRRGTNHTHPAGRTPCPKCGV